MSSVSYQGNSLLSVVTWPVRNGESRVIRDIFKVPLGKILIRPLIFITLVPEPRGRDEISPDAPSRPFSGVRIAVGPWA